MKNCVGRGDETAREKMLVEQVRVEKITKKKVDWEKISKEVSAIPETVDVLNKRFLAFFFFFSNQSGARD